MNLRRFRSRFLQGLCAVAALPIGPLPVAATPPGAKVAHATARLVAAGEAPGPASASRLAAIEVALDPGFLTYWRDPGEAGVPPRFDFSASDNLASADVRYPAPGRFAEGGVVAFGYEGAVAFPILAVPADPSRPVVLDVAMDYAVCADLCLPASAHLHATLEATAPPADVRAGREALARVPARRHLGEDGPVRIEALAPAPGRESGFVVRSAVPDGTAALFAEAPEGWSLEAHEGIGEASGRVSFTVAVLARPQNDARREGDAILTLVSPAGAIEVPVPLAALPLAALPPSALPLAP